MESEHTTASSGSTIHSRPLACGSSLLVESNSSLRSSSLSWWIPTGTMHDDSTITESGVSILCSGMLERGAGAPAPRSSIPEQRMETPDSVIVESSCMVPVGIHQLSEELLNEELDSTSKDDPHASGRE